MRRRRTFSSHALADEGNDDSGSAANRHDVGTAVARPATLESADASGDREESTVAREVVFHPFWSEKMQDEARLRAARPEDLGQLGEGSGNGSSSTELRPDAEHNPPRGEPISYGPIGGSSARAGEDPGHPEGSSVEVRAGMRPGERLVVQTMKDMLADLVAQNKELLEQNRSMQGRIERLEDENTMMSASSGGQKDQHEVLREFVHGVGGSSGTTGILSGGSGAHGSTEPVGVPSDLLQLMELQKTLLQNRSHAKESVSEVPRSSGFEGTCSVRDRSPPPPPPRDEVPGLRPTTPGGTMIPEGPPPRTPTPTFGSPGSQLTWDGSRSLWGLGSTAYEARPIPMPPSAPTSLLAEGIPGAGSLPLPTLEHPPISSRDPYAPGDRVWWSLPVLEEPLADQDAATRAADWLQMLFPLMSDLAPMSEVWWTRVVSEAKRWYQVWCASSSVERGQVVPSLSFELQQSRYRRLESRAYAMLQNALPSCVKDEVIASRSLHCVGVLYHVLRMYQPGGLAERTRLLDQLGAPGKATTASEAVNKLRAWNRALARASVMGISIPDSSIMLRGLDMLAEALLHKHVQMAFRCNAARNTLHLDHRPSLDTVREYAKVLQSELEMIAVSGADEPVGKKPKVAKVTNGPGNPAALPTSTPHPKQHPKAQGEGSPQDGDKGKGKKGKGKDGKGGKGKGPCRFFLNEEGCRLGRGCRSFHDLQMAQEQGKCFNCGSVAHRADQCSRPKLPKPPGENSSTPTATTSVPPKGPCAPKLQAVADRGESAGNGNATSGASGTQPTGMVSGANAQGSDKTAVTESGASGASIPRAASISAHQEVLQEAAEVLRRFRLSALKGPENQDEVPKVTEVRMRALRKPMGLLDGGATHPLRHAGEEELAMARPTQVSLAFGSTDLHVSPYGTLLSPTKVSPIVPLGMLIMELGCRVDWSDRGFSIDHPSRGRLPTVLEDGCPMVSEALCLELIGELEDKRRQVHMRQVFLRALQSGCSSGSGGWTQEGERLAWLKGLSSEAPHGLLARVPPLQVAYSGYTLPFNRKIRRAVERAKKLVIHLYSGQTKSKEFGNLGEDTYVLSVDLCQGANLLDDALMSYLLDLAVSGKVFAIVGGPPCPTFSALRDRASEDDGPRRVRGRHGSDRFGLPDLSVSERAVVDEHTVLIFRMLLLYREADRANPEQVMFGLEHPEDPVMYRKLQPPQSPEKSAPSDPLRLIDEPPSLWQWPELQSFQHQYGLKLARFDQGKMGHAKVKPTCFLTSSWKLWTKLHLDKCSREEVQLRRGLVPEALQDRLVQSKLWAKWAPGLVAAIGQALRAWIGGSPEDRSSEEEGEKVILKKLTPSEEAFARHCEADHVCFRPDCKTCLSGAIRSHLHVRNKYPQKNVLTLTADLIGPLVRAEDHAHPSAKVRHLLVAALCIPAYEGGTIEKLADGVWEEDHLVPDLGVEGSGSDVEIPEEFVIDDPEANPDEEDGKDPAPKHSEADKEGFWRAEAERLREPVKVKHLVFAEPLPSKKGPVVLKGLQKIYTRIRQMGLSVRRLHTDKGREFNNRVLEQWALSRDIYHTMSVPGTPGGMG